LKSIGIPTGFEDIWEGVEVRVEADGAIGFMGFDMHTDVEVSADVSNLHTGIDGEGRGSSDNR
jgi:hypothetical protein